CTNAAPGSCRHTWVNRKKDQTEDYGVEFKTLWARFSSAEAPTSYLDAIREQWAFPEEFHQRHCAKADSLGKVQEQNVHIETLLLKNFPDGKNLKLRDFPSP
ncbi:unnamed protein product, partial [Bubo scandiacus]